MNLAKFFLSFRPHGTHTPLAEKLRSGLAGGTAILLLALALHYLPQNGYPPILLASMAASAVLLYASPHSPFSQPWNLIGGHFISALAGWLCILFVHDPVIAAGVAVGAAIFLMYILNCLHPPGAATALTLVLGAAQFQQMDWPWAAMIVIDNAGISLLLALLINNTLPGRHYPASNAPILPKTEPAVQPEYADFDWALSHMGSVIDISTDALAEIYALAQEHAQTRFESKIKQE
jgi:CBS-domain-containing membrane protein